jgi:hypothetical protein
MNTELDSDHLKTIGGGDNSAADLVARPANNLNDVVKLAAQEDRHTINTSSRRTLVIQHHLEL